MLEQILSGNRRALSKAITLVESEGLKDQKEAHELLRKSGYFEPDELVKLKHLLEAIRLEGLFEIFTVPFEGIASWIRK